MTRGLERDVLALLEQLDRNTGKGCDFCLGYYGGAHLTVCRFASILKTLRELVADEGNS